MKDNILLRCPQHAEGNIRIDLTDPLTGKVKNRVEGKNHIFPDGIYSQINYTSDMYYTWVNTLSKAMLALQDSTTEISDTMPLLLGQTIGYGYPSTSGSGIYQGAYNATNQVIAVPTTTGIRWKFQYDFTTAQANGTIGTIGLTYQFDYSAYTTMKVFPKSTGLTQHHTYTDDSRYTYICDYTGVVTKYDNYLGSSQTIDLSSIVGTASADPKMVGYNPGTGQYYIFVYSDTAANRRMYVFTDNTFGTLSATYSPTNIALPWINQYYKAPLYVYGNTMFSFYYNTVYIADFASNTVITTQTITAKNPLNVSNYAYALHGCTVAKDTNVFILGNYNDPGGIIYSLTQQNVIGYMSYSPGDTPYCAIMHPAAPYMPTFLGANHSFAISKGAVAAKKLDSPVTKTSANGMTVTYELEVFW